VKVRSNVTRAHPAVAVEGGVIAAIIVGAALR
jgi:hypothetical protein